MRRKNETVKPFYVVSVVLRRLLWKCSQLSYNLIKAQRGYRLQAQFNGPDWLSFLLKVREKWINISRMLSVALCLKTLKKHVVQNLAWSALHQYILQCSGLPNKGSGPPQGFTRWSWGVAAWEEWEKKQTNKNIQLHKIMFIFSVFLILCVGFPVNWMRSHFQFS